MQCGVACLAMICRHFGRTYSIGMLSKLCFATAEGVSMLGINDAAEKLGLSTAATRMTAEQLASAPTPCILHWNQNHFTVLYKVSRRGDRYHIADPAKGKIAYSRKEFESRWLSTADNDGERKGIAMFFQIPDGLSETRPAVFSADSGRIASRKPNATCDAFYDTSHR